MHAPATLVLPDFAPILPAFPPLQRGDDLPKPPPHREPTAAHVLLH